MCRTDKRIEFRVGINLGDIIIDGDDIFGDGVNVAARLEGLARARRDLRLSDVARSGARQARPRLRGHGRAEVKNIARPVRVFRLATAGYRAADDVGQAHASRCPTSPRSRCCRSRT